MKKQSFILFLALASLASCKKENNEPTQTGSFLTGNGVFVLNEGNFGHGNGSLSFYSYDSVKIFNNLFADINGRPLGDVPNSMLISGDKIYIVVNNSGKIEVVERESLKSITTITGFNSPRDIATVSDKKAYVTCIYSDSVAILDTENDLISGYVNMRRTSEAIVVKDKKAYVANWIGGNEIMVINTETDKVVDSILVAAEPESMVIDKNNTLWVLCNGGWMREYNAELIAINTTSNEITKRLVFPSIEDSPSCLRVDGTGSTLYYLESGVRKLDINAVEIPSDVFISSAESYFYNLGINPVNSDIFVTDAVDYQQRGRLLIFDSKGDLSSEMLTDIIPGKLYFTIK